MSNREHGETDILQGTPDMMVLQTLTTLGPVHDAITTAGRCELASEKAGWERTASIIHTPNDPQ
jgi:hypothetical protein